MKYEPCPTSSGWCSRRAVLRRDVPHFDGSGFADKPDVPADILEGANRLLEVLDDALAATNKEWSEAEAADSTYQKLLADVRATAVVFELELQTFRRSLSYVAGRNDKDFQKLRSERASQADDEDDLDASAPPAPAAPPGTGNPTAGT